MQFNTKQFTTRGEDVVNWLEGEYSSIRTGQASPMLLDLVSVESYGTKVPIQQIGAVTVEDPKTLRVSVWDHSLIKEVERAIADADLGVSLSTDNAGLRVIFPDLTSERRQQLLKLAKTKLEDARVSLRGGRDEALKQVETELKSGGMTEDEKFNIKEEIQKLTDEFNKQLEDIYKRKESEINQ